MNTAPHPATDPETLVARYEARAPRYTEGDYVRRFAEIRAARATGLSGGLAEKPPGDRMVALLASGRVSDAEYFRLASLLGVDPTGLIYAEAPAERDVAWFRKSYAQSGGRSGAFWPG